MHGTPRVDTMFTGTITRSILPGCHDLPVQPTTTVVQKLYLRVSLATWLQTTRWKGLAATLQLFFLATQENCPCERCKGLREPPLLMTPTVTVDAERRVWTKCPVNGEQVLLGTLPEPSPDTVKP